MCSCRKWLHAQRGPYDEVGLINHNTTIEERERRGYMNIHTHTGLRWLKRAVVSWGEGLLHVAFMLVCLPFFFLLPSKGGESHKETGLPVALYFSQFC